MKVLHVGKYFPPYAGGMEVYLRDLMVEQSKSGLDSAAIVHRSELGLRNHREIYIADDIKLPIYRAAVWLRLLFTPISPGFALLLHRAIKEQQPDLLHLHMPNVSVFWALFMPSARSIPWVVHWHADVLASSHSLGLRLFYRLYRPFERWVLQRADRIIGTSPPYLQSSPALTELQQKCRVVALGLRPNLAAIAATVDGTQSRLASDGTLQVLTVGRLSYYKGLRHLIAAAASLQQVSIRIVGRGDLEPQLRQQVKSLGLESSVTFCGSLSDTELAKEYALCDCLCLPSIERTEAFGMVLLEAMSCGKATVVSDVPGSGMGWVVDDGITGIKVQPGDSRQLAQTLRQLQGDRARIAALGAAGQQKFAHRFHIRQSAGEIEQLYREVIPS